MTDSKSKCCQAEVMVCGKQSRHSTNWYECKRCGLPCDVVTDSKTAMEIAEKIVSEIMASYIGEIHRAALVHQIAEAITNERAEASDKGKRIEQLVEQMNAIRENFIEADTQVASLKSSLAEKEAELARIQRLPTLKWAEASADIMLEFASTARGGDKEAAQKMLAAFDKVKTYVNQLEAHLTYRERELDRHIFSSRVCIEGRDAQLDSLKQENAELLSKLEEAVQLGSGQAEQYDKELAQLQLENGVKDEAIKFVLEKCTLYGPHDRAIEKMKRALSTSTKSSLMEKVRNLVEIASRYNFTNWPEFMSALTEVKKELPHA